LIKDILAAFQTQADSAGVSLIFQSRDELSSLNLDPGRIRQVLFNLVANALRYTPSAGSVIIQYRQEDGKACLDIQDTGPGMPPEELSHVFERFYKSADSGGMGLGLAIARHLIEAHSGTISANSVIGQGTTMSIILPMGD
jgi:signal transduction histidine kinase